MTGTGVARWVEVQSGKDLLSNGCGCLRGFGLWLATALMLAGVGVFGCQVPVFRYALEQWAPSVYRVEVRVSASGLDEMAERALIELENARRAPIRVERVHGEGVARFDVHLPSTRRDRAGRRVLSADLNLGAVRSFLESPARVEIASRLLAGQTAVWLLLESGNRARDATAESVLGKALESARGKLKLPEAVAGEVSDRPGTLHLPPPRIDFSMLRVSRESDAERTFLAMLMGIEEGLEERSQDPMVFPVFGRGRALEPLIGRGITEENILEYGAYLCGPCSCEVKERNPGIDLMLTADWEPVDRSPRVEVVRIDARVADRATGARGGPEHMGFELIFVVGAGVAVVAAMVRDGIG